MTSCVRNSNVGKPRVIDVNQHDCPVFVRYRNGNGNDILYEIEGSIKGARLSKAKDYVIEFLFGTKQKSK